MIFKMKSTRFAIFALCAAILFVLSSGIVNAAPLEKTEGLYVYDEADVISAEIENDMNSRAKALFALTGSELVTVTVKSTGDKTTNAYAAELFSDWKLSADKNNAILILLSIDAKDYYVQPGSAITEKLSSDVLHEIFLASLEPDFAAGKYGDGAKKIFDDLLSRIEKIYSVDVSTYDPAAAQTAEEAAAPTETEKSGFSIGKFFKWLFIIVLIIAGVVAVITAVAFFRRPRYVNSGTEKRRHYNTERGAYVGMPEKTDIERARRREAMIRNQGTQQRPQGQQNRTGYPQGQQRPQGQQIRAGHPQRQQRPQDRQSRVGYPQGQQSQRDPRRAQNAPYPRQGQPRADAPAGQQYPPSREGTPRRVQRNADGSEHQTVYPERAPYVNRPAGGPSDNN